MAFHEIIHLTVLARSQKHGDYSQVLASNGRFEDQENLRNTVSRLRRSNRNYSHGSYAFSHHPLQITHEKHSNSQYGRFQNAIKHICHLRPGDRASHVGVRESGEGKVLFGSHKGSLKALPSSAWEKNPCSHTPQDSNIF